VRKKLLVPVLCVLAGACTDGATEAQSESPAAKVETTGKVEAALSEVPREVLAAAQAARPGFVPSEAQAETRDGRRYFDLGGRLPDGAEIEFDIMEEGGRWRVVETQRDLAFEAAPAAVRQAAAAHDSKFVPGRVIESVQNDGVTIYELYGPGGGNPQGRKVEVKLADGKAEVLKKEWAH
jgi:hypothetical protein